MSTAATWIIPANYIADVTGVRSVRIGVRKVWVELFSELVATPMRDCPKGWQDLPQLELLALANTIARRYRGAK